MPKKQKNPSIRYPDARLKGLRGFFELVRDEPTWKPDPITIDVFKALEVARGKESNAIFALKFLGILDAKGSPNTDFDNLRRDYQPTLCRLVRTSYAKLFQTIPIGRINQRSLVSFFMTQGYAEDTAEYQAMLFVDLCREAQILLPNAEASFKRARFRNKS
jgi:hypothetical protein